MNKLYVLAALFGATIATATWASIDDDATGVTMDDCGRSNSELEDDDYAYSWDFDIGVFTTTSSGE